MTPIVRPNAMSCGVGGFADQSELAPSVLMPINILAEITRMNTPKPTLRELAGRYAASVEPASAATAPHAPRVSATRQTTAPFW